MTRLSPISVSCLLATALLEHAAAADSTAEDLAQRAARSPKQVAEALAENYGHAMKSISYIPALALWGRLRLASTSPGTANTVKVWADVMRIADTAPAPQKWSSGSVVAGHLIYGAIDDRDRLLSAAAVGLDDDGKARDFVPGHNDMSDAVFMHCPVLAVAYRMTLEADYLDACLAHFSHMKALCLRGDGLYRHSPLDEAAWGRGNGFPALGIALVLSELDKEEEAYAGLVADHRAHLRALVKHQDSDGMWHQVIDHPESYAEFSCTCMIGFAMLRGMRKGWLDKAEFKAPADRAWRAINKRVRLDGEFLEGVCTGTGKQKSLQAYFDRKEIHGRDDRGGAMALMFATERMLFDQAKANR